MESTRTFQTSIIVSDPISFTSDKANIYDTIYAKFMNVCYQGIYITNILSINEVSPCFVENILIPGEGKINVSFTISGLKYARGDVLSGVIVQKMEGGILCGKFGTHANVNIIPYNQAHKQIILKEDNIICIIVDDVLFNPFSTITVSGRLLAPENTFETYYVNGELRKDDFVQINKLIGAIEIELETRVMNDILKFLEITYHSYKINKDSIEKYDSYEGPKFDSKKYINIIEALKKPDFSAIGTWSRPLDIPRTSPYVCKSNEELSLITPPNVAIISLLMHIFTWLKTINEQSRIFTDDLINTNLHVWKELRLAKLI